MSMFVHLHGHSTYSLLEGIGSVKSIVAKAKTLGMTSIGLTDYFGLYGMIDFFQSCKAENLTPIMGVELGFVPSITQAIGSPIVGNIVLLAKSYVGYHNLLQLVSYAQENHIVEKPCIDQLILQKYNKDIVGFMGGIHSYLGQHILQGSKDTELEEIVSSLIPHFEKHSFFLEIVAQPYSKETHLKKINGSLISLSEHLGIDLIVSANYHYLNKDDKDAYELALAIKDGLKLYDEERRKVQGDYYICSEEELCSILKKDGFDQSFIEMLIKNTEKVASMCHVSMDLYQSLFPQYVSPDYINGLYEKNKDKLIG